jgi:hypothetical protein
MNPPKKDCETVKSSARLKLCIFCAVLISWTILFAAYGGSKEAAPPYKDFGPASPPMATEGQSNFLAFAKIPLLSDIRLVMDAFGSKQLAGRAFEERLKDPKIGFRLTREPLFADFVCDISGVMVGNIRFRTQFQYYQTGLSNFYLGSIYGEFDFTKFSDVQDALSSKYGKPHNLSVPGSTAYAWTLDEGSIMLTLESPFSTVRYSSKWANNEARRRKGIKDRKNASDL